MGLTAAFEGAPICGGGMSAKSFLSSLMAVSTLALSFLVSVTYPRRAVRRDFATTRAARGRPRRGAAATAGLALTEPRRLADLRAHDARLAMAAVVMMAMAWR